MSDYRVVWPDEALDNSHADLSENEPAILQFRVMKPLSLRGKMDIITRARLLFDNRTCPECSYPVVTPLELNDALSNRNGLPIPGTATLVGFHCEGCQAEWTA